MMSRYSRARWTICDDYKFSFYVISAAPQEIIVSALEGIVPPDHIFGTRFRYKEETGEVESIIRASAGGEKLRCSKRYARCLASATIRSSTWATAARICRDDAR